MTTPTDVDGYLARVRAALDDLPPAAREELLEDLSEHLAEIAAEGEESLEARLGAPEAYAAELRAAAGLSGSAPRRPPFGTARARLQVLDTKIGPLVGYERTSDFLRLLRPGWWVLRGYLAGLVAVLLLNGGSAPGLIPRLGGSMVLALVVILACVVGSIWLGRVTVRLGIWPRRLVAAGSVALLVYGVSQFLDADSTMRSNFMYIQMVESNPQYVQYVLKVHECEPYVVSTDGGATFMTVCPPCGPPVLPPAPEVSGTPSPEPSPSG